MEQTVLLNFEIDQSKAIRDYEKLEKAIMDNKKAQQELAQAYKAQNITQEEYIADQARLSQNLSKETAQRNTLKKVIEAETGSLNAEKAALASLVQQRNSLNRTTDEGLKKFNALNKQIKDLTDSLKKAEQGGGNFGRNVGNYTESIKDAASQINIAGVSVGDFATKLTPATAAVGAATGVLTALGAAYASSATGARDLEAAHIRLSKAYAVASEGFAQLVNDEEQDIGIVEGLTIAILTRYVPALYAVSAAYADAAKKLKDLEISRAFAAGDAKNDERRAEILRRIRDDESQAIDDRVAASQKIDEILETSKQRTVIILQAEADAIRKSTVGYDKNREAQLQVAQITAEIADKEEEITGKLTENVTARRALLKLQQERLFLLEQEIKEANKPKVDLSAKPPGGGQLVTGAQGAFGSKDPVIQASNARIEQFTKELDAVNFTEKQKQEYYRQSYTIKQAQDAAIYASASSLYSALIGLAKQGSDEQKALALIGIGVDTAKALSGGIAASQDLPYPGNLIAMASTIATILANITAAKQYLGGFAEGGYTGNGHKYQPAGIVHAGEVVWNQKDVAAVGGPSAADRMRPTHTGNVSRGTYAVGGVVTSAPTSSITRQADQQMMIMNAIKNMPVPEVSVKEITRAADRIKVRERTSKLAS